MRARARSSSRLSQCFVTIRLLPSARSCNHDTRGMRGRHRPPDQGRKLATPIVVPAKAGIHFSAVSGADRWIPAFAGTTNFLQYRADSLLRSAAPIEETSPVKRVLTGRI